MQPKYVHDNHEVSGPLQQMPSLGAEQTTERQTVRLAFPARLQALASPLPSFPSPGSSAALPPEAHLSLHSGVAAGVEDLARLDRHDGGGGLAAQLLRLQRGTAPAGPTRKPGHNSSRRAAVPSAAGRACNARL